jgi:hypothetical protein
MQAEESFKGLRRKLPKTKQEFNWQVTLRLAFYEPLLLWRRQNTARCGCVVLQFCRRSVTALQGLSRHSLARELTAHTPTKSN